MYRFGYFRNLANELYKVIIITDYQQYHSNLGQQGQEEITLLSQPITIEYEGADDVFAPYRCSTMTVRFLQERFDEELNNTLGNNVFVSLQKEEKGKYKTIWQGFSTPQTYNQPFVNVVGDTFELECQDALSTLKYCYFVKQQTKKHLSVFDYVQLAFLQLGNLYTFVHFPTTPKNVVKSTYIQQQNFFDEDGKGKTYLEILSEICRYMNWTLVTEGDEVYFIDHHTEEYEVYNLQSGMKFPLVTLKKKHTLNKEDVSSNDCNISLLPSYNRITLTSKHYPIEKTQKKFEDENLYHCHIERQDLNFKKDMWLNQHSFQDDGRDSKDVQLWYIISNADTKDAKAHDFFIRYNYTKNRLYNFISHPKDGSNNRPLVNNEDFNKDIFFNYNACHPVEYYSHETDDLDALPKKISLKRGILYQTAFGKTDNNTLKENGIKGKSVNWTPFHENNNQVIFSHNIGHIVTGKNDNARVNINFNFKSFSGAFFPCRELKSNRYNGIQYRLRMGELYYDERSDDWTTTKHNCTLYLDDSGDIIQDFENWKSNILFENRKGLNIKLPRQMEGDVVFEFLRPYTGQSEFKVSDDKYLYIRYTPPANIISDYEATFIGLSDDDTETQYQNTLSDNRFIEEASEMELLITTFDNKTPNYSSPYYFKDNKTYFLDNMDFGKYEATAEESIILKRTCQFKTPQLKMEITLNRELGFNSIIESSWFKDKQFIVSSYSFDPQQINYTYTFIELKPLDDFEGVKKMSKPRKEKRNGDIIPTTDDSDNVGEETLLEYNMKKPTNFTLNKGHIIMTSL